MSSFKRHRNSHGREIALQGLYQIEIGNSPVAEVLHFKWLNEPLDSEERAFCEELIVGVIDHGQALDDILAASSTVDFSQISAIVRCIIKMGIYEIRKSGREPSIVMDDLLNLARRYEGDQAVPFINGILDRYLRDMQEAAVKRLAQEPDA
ncbi:MAG: hypothetical protein JNM27_02115 [Leptospirales bacterium]|nr:hypothetical protein [Leptospirales bacterium]